MMQMNKMEEDPDGNLDQKDLTTLLPPIRRAKEPGKWRGYDARRVFKKEWLTEYFWISSDPNDPTHALCTVCCKKIRAHKGDIEKHQKTKQHMKKQKTSDILADLIPMSCGLNNGDDYSGQQENLEETEHSEMNNSDARMLNHSVEQVGDGHQIIYLESALDSAQPSTNSIVDKLVEKYHQKRIDNLKVEHEATLELNKEQLAILKEQLKSESVQSVNKNNLAREEHEIRVKFLQQEHEARLKAIQEERDSKLQAIEQELMYTSQEYEKKMRLLDMQLSMK